MEQSLEIKDDNPVSEKIDKLKKENASKDANYKIVYDSIGEGIEPIYFWLLDFMQDKNPGGIGMEEVIKNKDEYEAAVGSGFFSDLGTKATRMQEQAMKMMGTINTVVRSIINLIYDLREFDIRLETYEDLRSNDPDIKEAAEIALRVIWMDQVDVKRGRGSINGLAQQLQFVTLRDAFLYAKDASLRDVNGNEIDLNERVKRILKSRLNEYFKWKNYSEKELRKRYNIEKAYLKSQYNALKYYTTWVKPYLIAAKKLNMSNFMTQSGLPNANIVNVFNNLEIRLTLFGKKEFKPENISPELINLKFDKKYYSCVEAEIVFRTVPRATQSQQGMVYLHSGRTDVNIKAYSFTDKELKDLEDWQKEEDLDLIEGMVGTSIKEIQEDIDKYLTKKDEEKEEKKKQKFENPFKGIYDGFRQVSKALGSIKNLFKLKDVKDSNYYEALMREKAKEQAEKSAYRLYDVYKKSHGMLAW